MVQDHLFLGVELCSSPQLHTRSETALGQAPVPSFSPLLITLSCTGVCGKLRPQLSPAVSGGISADPGLWHSQRASAFATELYISPDRSSSQSTLDGRRCEQTARFTAVWLLPVLPQMG